MCEWCSLALLLLLTACSRAEDTLPPSPQPQPLPDLVLDGAHMKGTLEQSKKEWTDECLVSGGCIPEVGEHHLLHFATRIKNVGEGDLVIGPPPVFANPSGGIVGVKRKTTQSTSGVNATWEWHDCHQHTHLLDMVRTELLVASTMAPVTTATKHGFCLFETACTTGVGNNYTCDNQGISAGCHDTYNKAVPCQWMVLPDDLPTQIEYILRATVDPTDFIPEENNTNNAVEVRFVLADVPGSAPRITDPHVLALLLSGLVAWSASV